MAGSGSTATGVTLEPRAITPRTAPSSPCHGVSVNVADISRTRPLIRLMLNRIRTWSAALPNLVADYPVFPEFYDEFLRPQMLARTLERLSGDTPQRAAVLAGCDDVYDRMATERPANEVAAEIALAYAQRRSPPIVN